MFSDVTHLPIGECFQPATKHTQCGRKEMEFIFCININDLVVNANLKTVVKREDLIKAAPCTPALAAATAEMQMTPVCARLE